MNTSTILFLVLGIGAFFLMMRMHGGHDGGHRSHDADTGQPAAKPEQTPERDHEHKHDEEPARPEPPPAHEHSEGRPEHAHSGH